MRKPDPKDVYDDIEEEFVTSNGLILSDAATDKLIELYNESVGHYVKCHRDASPSKDWWAVRRFRKYVITHIHVISHQLRVKEDGKPSAKAIEDVTFEVMENAYLRYCRTLPACPKTKEQPHIFGPICPSRLPK
jgi:hypothetical protein